MRLTKFFSSLNPFSTRKSRRSKRNKKQNRRTRRRRTMKGG
jgi:hypothetical protein